MDTRQLKKNYMKCATEYVRRFAEVIGYDYDFWIGEPSGESASFGGYYVFSLDQMRLVVDNLEKWKTTYDNVGSEVIGWLEYFADLDHYEERNPGGHPAINLLSWLNGARPTRKPEP